MKSKQNVQPPSLGETAQNLPKTGVITTSSGAPIDDDDNSITAGSDGPLLLQDFHYLDKISHFDRERIPERVVHAKGSGAHGYFELTKNLSEYTKAKFLDQVGKQTPLFIRFSTVGGEKGSPDSERDPRGFAIKFYTEEGNYDLVCNNTPVFFIRDPILFPDFIHTQKRNPQTNLKDRTAFWDFFSKRPESIHQVMFLFSDRGIPADFRHMHGFGNHTFKWVNDKGEVFFVKYHINTDQGIKNLTPNEADALKAKDPDHATRDLFENIEKGNFPAWTVSVQIIPEAEAASYKYDILDVTKVVHFSDYPKITIGKIVLNRNPKSFFAEVEQVAFSPSHFVPGIEPSADKLLQGRIFSYPDTQFHRLGTNHIQIPINCPYRAKIVNGERDGDMVVNGGFGALPNYFPNSFTEINGHVKYQQKPFQINGIAKRHPFDHGQDYEQPGLFWRKVLTPETRDYLVKAIADHMKDVTLKDIQVRMIQIFNKVDPEFGENVASELKMKHC